MNSKTKVIVAGVLTLLIAGPAFAQNTATGTGTGGTSAGAAMQTRIAKGKARADQEIGRRLTALNELNAKVQAMTKVSASAKTAILNEVTTEVNNLTALKAKIDADTDITTLKTDVKSITGSYRIFVLVIPQGRIEVAADKIGTTADAMTAFASKLHTRISAAQSAGKDVTALNSSLTDMTAKIADANTQVAAAVSHVASLVPDNGDKVVMAANNAALKQARADIKVALSDLQAARKDAGSILQGLQSMSGAAAATTTP